MFVCETIKSECAVNRIKCEHVYKFVSYISLKTDKSPGPDGWPILQ